MRVGEKEPISTPPLAANGGLGDGRDIITDWKRSILMGHASDAHWLTAIGCAATATIALLTPTPTSAAGGPSYSVYRNAKYEYSICYPPNLLKPQPEAASGDGRKFVGANGVQLLALGRYNVLDETVSSSKKQEKVRFVN